MLTQQEIIQLNQKLDIGVLLTFLNAPIRNLHDLGHKGTDFRINCWWRSGTNPHGCGITYNFDKGKYFITDFTRRTFGNLDLVDFLTKVIGMSFHKAIDLMVFSAGKTNGFANRSIDSCKPLPANKLEVPVPIDPSVMNIFDKGLHVYWQSRGYTHEIAERFELGFCNAQYGNLKHRLTIPMYDDFNRLVAIQGRAIDDDLEPKYTYAEASQGESAKLCLYNYTYARHYGKERGWVGIVESPNSVWRAEQYGYKNFLSSMGTSVTDRQLELLVKLGLNVTIFFDYDEAYSLAGQIGAVKLAKRLVERNIRTWLINPRMVCDPASLTSQQFQFSLKGGIEYHG